jgi:hypothetical protein
MEMSDNRASRGVPINITDLPLFEISWDRMAISDESLWANPVLVILLTRGSVSF